MRLSSSWMAYQSRSLKCGSLRVLGLQLVISGTSAIQIGACVCVRVCVFVCVCVWVSCECMQ